MNALLLFNMNVVCQPSKNISRLFFFNLTAFLLSKKTTKASLLFALKLSIYCSAHYQLSCMVCMIPL